MIEERLIGKTTYGGEVIVLKADKPYEIPAIRIHISTQRRLKESNTKIITTTEEFIEYINRHPEATKTYVKKILRYHHGDIGEMDTNGIYFKSVSRLFTFISWIPIGANRGIKGVGTERSMRYTTQEEQITIQNQTIKKVNRESVELYRKLIEEKIPKEDARYILPLTTKTEEIIHIQMGRDLAKYANYLKDEPFEEAKTIGKLLLKWNEEENGFTLPTIEKPTTRIPQTVKEEDRQKEILKRFLADKQNKIYYDPYTQSLIWNTKRSIASLHQDVRNRQVYFWWPSWESIINNNKFYIPKTIPKELIEKIKEHYYRRIEISKRLYKKGEQQMAVYTLPMGKKIDVYCALYGNENIYETIRLRACMKAQHEIRRQYRLIMKTIEKRFPRRLGARCETEGLCFEPQKEKCPLYQQHIARKANQKPAENHLT